MNILCLLLVIIINVAIRKVSSTCNEKCAVFASSHFNDKKVLEYIVWSDVNSGSIAACTSKCRLDYKCKTAGYSSTTGECSGYAVGFTSPNETHYDVVAGFKMYPLCKAANFIGSPCSNSDDCHVTNADCLIGQCTCEIGYSFSLNEPATCAEDCTKYGSLFLKYDSKSVINYNDKTLTNVTVDECKALCIQETEFVCKSIEYHISKSDCSLMMYRWLEVSFMMRSTNDDFAIYTRSCSLD